MARYLCKEADLPKFVNAKRNVLRIRQVGDDGTRSGWLADDGRFLKGPAAATTVDWRIADMCPGDIIVLGARHLLMRPPLPTRSPSKEWSTAAWVQDEADPCRVGYKWSRYSSRAGNIPRMRHR